ncbi:putative uncharacterized protein [Methanoculleus sp. CAG:1088]|nr:putative uncharacterized protein [Methanoculleus sp. CAG:1088]
MASILISYYSDYGETMYDALGCVLHDNGNRVMMININNSSVQIDHWGGCSKTEDSELIKRVKSFDADIVLDFNFSLPLGLIEVVEKTSKICVIDADNPSTFWNKDYHLKNSDKYYYLGLQSYSWTMYCQYLNRVLEENKNYMYFPPATAINNMSLKQDKNISFIGSNFYPLSIPPGEDFYSKMGLDLFDALKKNYYLTVEEARQICKGCSNPEWLLEKVRAYYVGQDRLKYMQVLVDLGFTFYGVRWWNHIAYYDFELAKCFDPTPKVSLEDNQWVYNTSKISVNISHPQAKSSFSWRVMDIMASNACLLMEDKKDWRDLFERYLSKETLDHVIYADRYDLRKKAIELLNDDELRNRCVKDLNNAIEQNGRWNHRLFRLQNFLDIPLMNMPCENEPIVTIGRGLNDEAKISQPNMIKKLQCLFKRITD